jgi:DNA-directed RNA polymerase I, II, and III subunit RPABC2
LSCGWWVSRPRSINHGKMPKRFIKIPENATTSLEIAMEELKQRVIPIVIKRTLPNGDYQNIPIDQFA